MEFGTTGEFLKKFLKRLYDESISPSEKIA